MDHNLLPGRPFPLGATTYHDGVNFCLFSKNCTAVELLLFDDVDAAGPARVIRLDHHRHRTFYYWHAFIRDVRAGQLYGYRVHGPLDPEQGHRFDGTKVLLDPYSQAVAQGRTYDREAAVGPGDNAAHCLKSVVVDPHDYDWEHDYQLRRPFAETVIYEMHVGGFTRHPSSGVAAERRGTFAGVVEKIPYLQALGVTAVELLPVQYFDAQPLPGRTDYWGYNPLAFFAPHGGYSSTSGPLAAVHEFRDMVKALHRAGIEVILDMVFNHTSEGDEKGPTLSFRGLENRAYYILESNRARYANYTGCGNTINGNHSIVRRMILDCLRHWVRVMHVDGFRFDLASVLARGEFGEPLRNPPILWEIESDPVLSGCKIIAEAWDAAGLYQVGSFVGDRWAEWNGHYRDDVRRFVKGDVGVAAHVAARLVGSPDVYPLPNRDPNRSINFVTCHDGFTLEDLVTYNDKHNQDNGENNRDGADANFSWNCGVEGPTDRHDVEDLRTRQIKNLFTLLLTSHGTPMFLMGDEVRRGQRGNNNPYCQDNEISWFDWQLQERHADVRRFVSELIRFRLRHVVFKSELFWTRADHALGTPVIIWHGVRLHAPDWGRNSRSLAYEIRSADAAEHLYVIVNAYWEPLTFELPAPVSARGWRRLVDTTFPSPGDFLSPGHEVSITGDVYQAGPRSTVILSASKPYHLPGVPVLPFRGEKG